jgi:hypothetical protein
LLVTDSDRIDRREDLDAQAAVLLAIGSAGGDVISITEPNYGKRLARGAGLRNDEHHPPGFKVPEHFMKPEIVSIQASGEAPFV